MRRPLHLLAGAVASVTTLFAFSATPVGASVPGADFTRTQCETYSDSVARLYTAALDREPEQGGFDWWMEEYTQGRWTLPRMAQYFVESPEFQTKYGALDDPAYVAQIYRNVLDREPDDGGLAFWIGQMADGMDRPTLLLRFSESPENITNSGTTQPALGDYNEGRVPGAWVCGPDLMPYLPTASDLGSDLRLVSEERAPARSGDLGCDGIGYVPERTVGRLFVSDDFGTVLAVTAHPFATTFGVERFLDDLQAAQLACESWTDAQGRRNELFPIEVGPSGDRTVSYRHRIHTDLGLLEEDIVYVRVGRVLTALSVGNAFGGTPPVIADYVVVTSSNLSGVVPS